VSKYLYLYVQHCAIYVYSAEEQHRTVIQTNILLSVLQLLLALIALACVVLAEPQYVQLYGPIGRPRLPGIIYGPRVRPDRPRYYRTPPLIPIAAPIIAG
jgi:hypothetical protein